MTDGPPASRPFNPLLVIGALIGLIALVAVLAFALSQRDADPLAGASQDPTASVPASEAPAPSATTSASPSASASIAPEPSESATAPVITWEAPAPFDGQPEELFVDGETWVAAGWASERGPAAWTSSDAIAWERADVPDPVPDERFRGSGLGPTVRLGDSLLSFGTFIGCCDGRGVLGWRSADGTSWEVIESDSRLFDVGYLINALAVGDATLVATEVQYPYFHGRIWRWMQETSWVETTPVTADTEGPSGMNAHDVAFADGTFVVVGSRSDPTLAAPEPGPITATSWISTDGETWQASATSPELEDVDLLQVAPMPGGGFVALGIDDAQNSGNAGRPVAFTSPDGLTWTPGQLPSVGLFTRPVEIVPVDGGLVAMGSEASETTIVWSSADGADWTDAGRLDFTPLDVAALGNQLVVISADFDPAEPPPAYVLHRGTLVP